MLGLDLERISVIFVRGKCSRLVSKRFINVQISAKTFILIYTIMNEYGKSKYCYVVSEVQLAYNWVNRLEKKNEGVCVCLPSSTFLSLYS